MDRSRRVMGPLEGPPGIRSEEHTSELQSLRHLVCRLLLEQKKRSLTCVAGCRLLSDWRAPARYFARPSRSPPSRRNCGRARASSSFFFNDTATTEIYTLSLHDALPI